MYLRTSVLAYHPLKIVWHFLKLGGSDTFLHDATPSFFLNSKSPISGLSNDISFVSSLLLEGALNGQNKKSFNLGAQELMSPTVCMYVTEVSARLSLASLTAPGIPTATRELGQSTMLRFLSP